MLPRLRHTGAREQFRAPALSHIPRLARSFARTGHRAHSRELRRTTADGRHRVGDRRQDRLSSVHDSGAHICRMRDRRACLYAFYHAAVRRTARRSGTVRMRRRTDRGHNQSARRSLPVEKQKRGNEPAAFVLLLGLRRRDSRDYPVHQRSGRRILADSGDIMGAAPACERNIFHIRSHPAVMRKKRTHARKNSQRALRNCP